jgi:hypothetical protein
MAIVPCFFIEKTQMFAGTIAKMSAITFLLSPSMTKDDLQTELYGRIANLPNGPDKQATEAFLCIGVSYENIRTTGRVEAANAQTNYVEPTCDEYEKMIDDTETSFSQPGPTEKVSYDHAYPHEGLQHFSKNHIRTYSSR